MIRKETVCTCSCVINVCLYADVFIYLYVSGHFNKRICSLLVDTKIVQNSIYAFQSITSIQNS